MINEPIQTGCVAAIRGVSAPDASNKASGEVCGEGFCDLLDGLPKDVLDC
jgi:hypothetical protein